MGIFIQGGEEDCQMDEYKTNARESKKIMMKAVHQAGWGGREQLTLKNVRKPQGNEKDEGKMLVRVAAVSMRAGDSHAHGETVHDTHCCGKKRNTRNGFRGRSCRGQQWIIYAGRTCLRNDGYGVRGVCGICMCEKDEHGAYSKRRGLRDCCGRAHERYDGDAGTACGTPGREK